MSSNRVTPSLRAVAAVLALGISARAASAQTTVSQFEVRPFVGAFIPTGDQRDLLEDAVLTGAEVSLRVAPALSITGAFGWSPSEDRITPGSETLDVYQYDVGLELRGVPPFTSTRSSFAPFAGIGVGGRTYDYRDLDVGSKTNFDGYAALGGDFGLGRVGVRVEARDYVSQFKPLTGGGDTKTRNDVGIVVGLTYHF